MATNTAPARHIARDTHTGKHAVRGARRSGIFITRELAAMAETAPDRMIILWEFSGHVNGQPLYVRTRFVAQADRSLAGYSSDGQLAIVHPADRTLRVLTRSAA